MYDPSRDRAAAVCAVRGESDLDAVRPALGDNLLAQVIAFASHAHRLIRMLAALGGRLPALLDPQDIADPALHAALARLIGTHEGRPALCSWAEVAPAGWGRAHAEALLDAVRENVCDSSVAAALIGPGDDSAALLHVPHDTAFAIRRWGQSSDNPTAWTKEIAPAERNRLITVLQRDPFQVAFCLPWLPPDAAYRTRLDDAVLGTALDALAAASPTVRAHHAALVQLLVGRTTSTHLGALTRLACVVQTSEVWDRVQTLIRASSGAVRDVVAAAPWDDLPEEVHTAILDRADHSDICAAIAVARGRRNAAPITWEAAGAFFAALAPAVWDELDAEVQQRWRDALWELHAHLAIRTLGLRPEVLARARMGEPLVRAARRHADDDRAFCDALFPVALYEVDLVTAHALIAALPTMPRDPGAFFCIAGRRDDPTALTAACAALRTPDDLALAVTLQRGIRSDDDVQNVGEILQDALQERTWSSPAPIRGDDIAAVATVPMLDRDALADALAPSDRRDALRQTLTLLSDLPAEIDIPTRFALAWRNDRRDADDDHETAAAAATVVASVLRGHGDVFLNLVHALADDAMGKSLLPLPDRPKLANALRALARSDALSAHRLAHAMLDDDRTAAIRALLTAPPRESMVVWRALSRDDRHAIWTEVPAASPHGAAMVAACATIAARDPITALALAAMVADDADMRDIGIATLTARHAYVRAFWDSLPHEVQGELRKNFAFADLGAAAARADGGMRRRRSRA